MVNACACGGAWMADDLGTRADADGLLHRVAGRCARCGAEREFQFAMPAEARAPGPVREINPTAEPSRAVDALQWLDLARFYLGRIDRLHAPAERAASLLDARLCLEETLKFFGPGDALPADAVWSDTGRKRLDADLAACTRSAVEAMLAKIPPARQLHRVDAPDQREFQKAVRTEAKRRVGRKWWQFWKHTP